MRTIFTALCLAALIFGCSKNASNNGVLDSDANGFQCRQCKVKFYTARSVYADACPACKNTDLTEVVGFVCDKDQHLTIAPKAKSAPCEKCNEPVGRIKLPTSTELIAWGAKRDSEIK